MNCVVPASQPSSRVVEVVYAVHLAVKHLVVASQRLPRGSRSVPQPGLWHQAGPGPPLLAGYQRSVARKPKYQQAGQHGRWEPTPEGLIPHGPT